MQQSFNVFHSLWSQIENWQYSNCHLGVRLRLEEGWSFPMIQERLGITSNLVLLKYYLSFVSDPTLPDT